MSVKIRDWALYAPMVASHCTDAALERARVAFKKFRGNEKGQTPTEYLMIVGLMAAAIVTIFVTFFWTTIREAASSWATKVKDAVLGTAMN